jgi:hypothetical protein
MRSPVQPFFRRNYEDYIKEALDLQTAQAIGRKVIRTVPDTGQDTRAARSRGTLSAGHESEV